MSNNEHAIYSPSACYRNMSCKGAIALSAVSYKTDNVKPSSKYAAEGTLFHEWQAKALNTIHSLNTFDFQQVPEDMRGYLYDICAIIGEINTQFRKSHDGVRFYIEKRVKYDDDLWGTVDYMLTGIHRITKQFEAVVCDTKYGAGVQVDAEDNEQLLCYLLCAQKELGVSFGSAVAVIFQPRVEGNEYVKWKVDGSVLNAAELSIIQNKRDCLEVAARGAASTDLLAGDHCRFCPAGGSAKVPICEAYLTEINSTKLKVLDNVPEIPVIKELSGDQKLEIFKRRKLLKKFIDDICADVLTSAVAGDVPDGYKIVEGVRRRKWSGDVTTVGLQLSALGVENPYKTSLIGIGEVEKQIGKGKLEGLTELSKPTYQLVPMDDKRLAIGQIGLEGLTEINLDE